MEGSLIFYGTNLEDAFGNQNWVSNISYSCQTTKDSGIFMFLCNVSWNILGSVLPSPESAGPILFLQ